tara:strand:- start:2450 stop:3064 length:615 start_codon:yes stop_codon:yes gene_type:complete
LFVENDENVSLGKKITPIEVFDNSLETGFGEATKRGKQLINRPSLKEKSQKEKKIEKPLDQQKTFEEINLNKNIKEQKVEQKNSKNNNINQPMLRQEIGSGSIEGVNNNEPEKGSLKGKGAIKVTCLKCIRPTYPPIALRRGAEGTPIVKAWINKKGIVFKAELKSTSGNKSIDNAAIKAAINSTFYPLEEESSINIEYDLKIR